MLAPDTRSRIERALLVTCFFKPVLAEVQQARQHMSGQARRLLDAMLATPTTDGKPDITLTTAHLRATANGETGQALEYLYEVLQEPANSSHVGDYIACLARDDRLLEAESACVAAAEAIREGDGEARVREHLDAAKAALDRDQEQDQPAELDLEAILSAEQTEPVPWAVHGLFAKGDILVVGGEGGTGKSVLALDLAIALATGQSFLGMVTAGAQPVLYLDEENQPHIVRRRIRQHLLGRCIPEPPAGLHYYLQAGMTLRDASGMARLQQLVDEHNPRWVVLDSLIRFLGGADENSNTDAAQFFARLKGERVRSGVGWIVLAHLAKPSKDRPDAVHRIRGAGDIVNGSDALLTLEGDRDTERRTLTPQQRRTSTLAPLSIAWRESEDEQSAELMSLGTESGSAEAAIRRAIAVVGQAGILRQDLIGLLESQGFEGAAKATTRALGKLVGMGVVRSEKEGRAVRLWIEEQAR